MTDLLSRFEQDCADAEIKPRAALVAGGVHPTLWKKWKTPKEAGGVQPSLRSYEAALRGLEALKRERSKTKDNSPRQAA